MKLIVKRVLLWGTIAVISLTIITAIFINLNTYNPMEKALESMKRPNVVVENNTIIFNPEEPPIANVVFYQGGLVKTEAYAVLGQSLAQEGIRVFMPQMFLNLAITNTGAFENIRQTYENGQKWFIGGHSLGGASASIYTANNVNNIDGIFFLGSYPSASSVLAEKPLKVLSVHATNDQILNYEKYIETKDILPTDTVFLEIEGGNHSNFGYYGLQRGDGKSNISREVQHDLVVEAIVQMIKNQ
ncbi:alpha/beta hydrolase [Alkalihalobacterium chitinilyticum]|uniref:Alpha/beta hydrolase n=1 Tax=Alkalihalobacterium chitinilyticum TaxID=2980103 RepID=A0ABT5VI52_9BACI|nr:alpha/beta hydrolase [Alkalihalobacterium chitinilyticum]MDE5415129.1 alpha/beta hydrolase [Alkalihalobacterium chitinilyticum]